MTTNSYATRYPPVRSVPVPAAGRPAYELKCSVDRDRFGRIIYAPGDGVGVMGTGPLPWLSEKTIVPHTDLYHFLVIGDYIEEEDDYVILESIGKGTALGRLSWYADTNYTVFRMNDPDYAALGKRAVELASCFGRRHYDFMLYARLFTWAAGYWGKEILTAHIPPRPITTDKIPYKPDQNFICIELYFEIWKLVGRQIQAEGCAPLPAEVINAVNRGTLAVIDHHNGKLGEPWREPRGPINNYPKVVGALAEDVKPFDTLVLGKDGLVYKDRPASSVKWSTLGQSMEIMKKDTIVQVDLQRGYVTHLSTQYVSQSSEPVAIPELSFRNAAGEEPGKIPGRKMHVQLGDAINLKYEIQVEAESGVRPSFPGGVDPTEPKLVTDEEKLCANCGRSPCLTMDGLGRACHLWEPKFKIVKTFTSPPVVSGPDLIARPLGQKRNRIHIYRQPFGYPIRLCDWVARAPEDLEMLSRGVDNRPIENESLKNKLEYWNNGKNICKFCQAIVEGKRSPPVGERFHGHGKETTK